MESKLREEIARIIRKALVENWICYETASKWDEDVLLTGCKKVGNGMGYQNPEQAAQNLALDAADALLPLLNRAKEEGAREMKLAALRAARKERDAFHSAKYASNQPHGSLPERFACEEVARAIRALPLPAPQNMGGEQ